MANSASPTRHATNDFETAVASDVAAARINCVDPPTRANCSGCVCWRPQFDSGLLRSGGAVLRCWVADRRRAGHTAIGIDAVRVEDELDRLAGYGSERGLSPGRDSRCQQDRSKQYANRDAHGNGPQRSLVDLEQLLTAIFFFFSGDFESVARPAIGRTICQGACVDCVIVVRWNFAPLGGSPKRRSPS